MKRPRRSRRWTGILVVGIVFEICRTDAGAQVVPSLTVDNPATDLLTSSATIQLSGQAICDEGLQQVAVHRGPFRTLGGIAGSNWSASVTLEPGLNVLSVTACAIPISKQLLVVRASQIAVNLPQKVAFEWMPGALEAIQRIATQTLSASLSASELAEFSETVRDSVPAILVGRYPVGALELVPSSGPDIQTIQMLGDSGDIFGQSIYDCGNTQHQGTSEVWVGTYAQSMKNLAAWSPMSLTDPVSVRAEDVSQALARTAAHELGHSIGFVGSGLPANCGWMSGCDGGHNCAFFQSENSGLVDRFSEGRYIMDPGQKTKNFWRIASEPVAGGRSTARRPAVFSGFDNSYLSMLAGKVQQ